MATAAETLPGWKNLKFDVDRSKLATSTQESFDSVQSTAGAIGFGPFTSNLESNFTVIHLNGISPIDANYPSTMTLSLIYRDANVTKLAFRFLDFVFTSKGEKAVRNNGGIPVAREPKPTT